MEDLLEAGEGADEVAAKRPRVCGEEVIQRRLVGAPVQNMLDIMRMAFFPDVEASVVLMTEILASRPQGVRDEWMDVPLPVGIVFGVQVRRKERKKLFDTERQGFNEVKRTVAWSVVGSGKWVDRSIRRGRKEKYEFTPWVGYTIFVREKGA